MSTAKQLIPALVEAEPLTWDRAYSKNMRPIRGYPDYWRIIDDEAYIDGPPAEGDQWDGNLYLWRAKILKDDNFDLTDTVEVVNLGDYLSVTSEEVGGETVYQYKYNSSINSFQYQHTNPMDSVSIEFDQSGRRLIAFESTGNIYFVRFDPVAGTEVTDNFGLGHNPIVVTDTYRREGGSADSERLLFYVKDSTKQIVYRKQDDRFQVEYALPSATDDVVEILKISKNIYGGLTVLYCYDNSGDGIGEGSLITGSFTATAGVDQIEIGSDDRIKSRQELIPNSGGVTTFLLAKAILDLNEQIDSAALSVNTGATITNFDIKSSTITLNEQTDSAALSNNTGATITNFDIKDSVISAQEQTDSAALSVNTGATITNFDILVALIEFAEEDQATLTPSTGSVPVFTLG